MVIDLGLGGQSLWLCVGVVPSLMSQCSFSYKPANILNNFSYGMILVCITHKTLYQNLIVKKDMHISLSK